MLKIQSSTRAAPRGLRQILTLGDKGRWFALLDTPEAGGVMSGYFGEVDEQGLATVRPVQIRSAAVDPTSPSALEALASWIMIRASGLKAMIPKAESDVLITARSGQASAWARFLKEREISKGPSGKSVLVPNTEAMSLISIPSDQANILYGIGIAYRVRAGNTDLSDELVTRRHPAFRSGPQVSGFTAYRVHEAVADACKTVQRPASLDLEAAKRALASVSRPTAQAVAFYGVTDPALAERRAQAARAYPILAGLIAESSRLSSCVDQMQPISEALQDRTGLSKASLKRIGKLTVPLPDGPAFGEDEQVRGEDALGVDRLRRSAVRGTVTLGSCLSTLARMPPDRTPQTDPDWTSFVSALAGCATPIGNVLGRKPEEILEASKGDWSGWRRQLARASDFNPDTFERRNLTLATIDAIESLEDFSRAVILPLALRSIQSTGQALPPQTPEYMRQAFQVGVDLALGRSKSVAVSLLEIGRRYASRIPSLIQIDSDQMSQRAIDATAVRWAHLQEGEYPALAQAWQAPNGLVVTPLTTFDMLRTESGRLGHCVGRLYLDPSMAMRSHIFSVQTADHSRSLSTIELSGLASEGNHDSVRMGLRIVQHRGSRNENPQAIAVAASEAWLAAIYSGEIALNIDECREFKAYQSALRQNTGRVNGGPAFTWKGALGTDWANPEKVARHWEEWTGIIGTPGVRGPGPDVLFRHDGMRRLVEDMSPAAATILAERARAAQAAAVAAPQADALPEP